MSENNEKLEEMRRANWIDCSMFIEAMAGSPEFVKKSLEGHIEKLSKEKGVFIYEKSFDETDEVDNPLPNIPKGYSQIVEIRLTVKRIEDLLRIVIKYCPSSVEVLSPESIKINITQMQDMLNLMAEIIHKFAQAGVGGVVMASG